MGPGNELIYNSMNMGQNFENNETSGKYPEYCRTIRVQGVYFKVFLMSLKYLNF
jgi:hypothetical protein